LTIEGEKKHKTRLFNPPMKQFGNPTIPTKGGFAFEASRQYGKFTSDPTLEFSSAGV
jgi:hypothetical protein